MAKQEKAIRQGEYASVFDCTRGPSTLKSKRDIVYTENMYPAKGSEPCLESIPGVRTLCDLGKKIQGLYHWHTANGEDYLIIHSGTYLYRITESDIGELATVEPLLQIGTKKCAFAQMNSTLYVFCGTLTAEIRADGTYRTMSTEEGSFGHVPITYINGQINEPRNLFNERFMEKYTIEVVDDLSYGTPELIYSITDKDKKLCAVTGICPGYSSTIYIPRYKKLNGINHLVTEVAPNAFSNKSNITKIITNRGLERIGSAAFISMPNLSEVYLSDSVKELGEYSLSLCENLSHIYIGTGLKSIGKAAFLGCGNLSVDYAGSSQMMEQIENNSLLTGAEISYHVRRDTITFVLPVFTPFKIMHKLTLNASPATYDFIDPAQGLIITADISAVTGKTYTVTCSAKRSGKIFDQYPKTSLTPIHIISGCTVAYSYGGRIFLSGNPELPGAVFYSDTLADGTVSPVYFSDNSYFIAGSAQANVTAMTTIGSALAVFTEKRGTEENVFLYKPAQANGKTIFQKTSVLSHCSITDAMNFRGEAIFASTDRISTFRGTSGKCTAFETVSDPIQGLLSDESAEVCISEWDDFLAIGIGEKLFLADYSERISVNGTGSYDWYYIRGAAGYKNDLPLDIYADEPYSGISVNSEKAGSPIPEEAMLKSVALENGEFIYFIEENGEKIRVYRTPYRYGGEPEKITSLANFGGRLLIGTECGKINTFNHDMTGIAPNHIKQAQGFDADEYQAESAGTLHPFYYTFCGHIPNYRVITSDDDGERFYLGKRMVKGSAVISFKPISGRIRCDMIFDGDKRVSLGSISTASLDFSDFNFGNAALSGAKKAFTAAKSSESDWNTVCFSIASEELSPFGIYSIAYRYTFEDNPPKETK